MSSTEFFDRLIISFDHGLRTLLAAPAAARPIPSAPHVDEPVSQDKTHSVRLMRINHAGEVCAQALYQGQALTARSSAARELLEHAAKEEQDHLAWCATRLTALGGHTSVLNPLFYAGSFALGAASGVLGDKWNMAFLAETERQVEGHLAGHIEQLPATDSQSRAVLEQMRADEALHAQTASEHGAADMPAPVKLAMKLGSKVMTKTAYWV